MGSECLQFRGKPHEKWLLYYLFIFVGTAIPNQMIHIYKWIFLAVSAIDLPSFVIALYTVNLPSIVNFYDDPLLDHKARGFHSIWEMFLLFHWFLGRPMSFAYYNQLQLTLLHFIWILYATITWAGHTFFHNENDLISLVHLRLWTHDSPFTLFLI